MHVAARDGQAVVLEASPGELVMLKKMLQAGIEQIETVSITTLNSVPEAVIRGFIDRIPAVSKTDTEPASFRLSKDEFFDLNSVLGVVNVLDPEDYFPDLYRSYPDDAQLDAFVDHLDAIYSKIFAA